MLNLFVAKNKSANSVSFKIASLVFSLSLQKIIKYDE